MHSFKCVALSDQIQFREGSEPDSDTGSEPERYDRRTQLNEHYQEKLGFSQEDDDQEEEKEVRFYIFLLIFSSFYFVINYAGGENS